MDPMDKSYDVVGIGNAIVDVLVQADDDLIANFELTKGTMALVDQAQAERLYAALDRALKPLVAPLPTPWPGLPNWAAGRALSVGCATISWGGSLATTSVRLELALTPLRPRRGPPRPVA